MSRTYSKVDVDRHYHELIGILREVITAPGPLDRHAMRDILRQYPKDGKGFFGRDELIHAYHVLTERGDLPDFEPEVVAKLRRKPVRTASGVTPVTVLTKPFPCPGECIFCPNDVRMPKSYLSDEPGAQRAEMNSFDPYLQTYSRLLAYRNIGHPTDKIEMIILGGTWSFYPETYQIWFIKRIFDALHDFGNGVDNRPAVEAAIKDGSQLHPEHNTSNVQLFGVEPGRTYNQVVQEVYRDEMRRSRVLAQAVADAPTRSPIDEFATWEELEAAHHENETATCRCVGLVIETRPDHISAEEVLRVRRLGCTKVQIGFQSLNDDVLRVNRRGHNVAATRRAVKLLRQAGFKIHAHWMPNLYGSNPQMDVTDYETMFADADFRPDELKIYPCSLIESAELMQVYQRGDWQPYTHHELLDVLAGVYALTPEYCRLTRVIRDIPSTDIVDGNHHTNLRQMAENAYTQRGGIQHDIRAREIRHRKVARDDLHLDEIYYTSGIGDEIFLQYITEERQIAGFLRLSLPTAPPLTDELKNAAMIREVHVYGQAVSVGQAGDGKAQHSGLGTALIERAVELARDRGYSKLAVISAIGTREYYRSRGFSDGQLYQHYSL
ncbi:MAG: tRNA uridine(34) 5-carboxymethylaminomethyl modification radical SAM/GNAT enzyme Elp3 [Chloroflexota bacterium]